MPHALRGNHRSARHLATLCAGLVALIAPPAALPDDPPAAANDTDVAAARTLLEAKRFDEARAALEALAEKSPDAEIHRLLGEVDYQLARWPDAREHLREAIRLDEIADDHLRLGEVYMQEHRYALALAQFRDAWRMGIMDANLHQRLAAAYLGLGRILGEVRQVHAPDAHIGDRVADAVLVEPNLDKPGMFWAAPSDSAVYQVQRARALGADTLAVRLLEARIWLQARQYARSVECFSALEDELTSADLTDADRARAYADFAEACFRADDLEGYLHRVESAYASDRDRLSVEMGKAQRRVAQRYADRGELAECIRHLERAVAESPRDPELHHLLGERYWEAGDSPKAARAYRIYLQLAPAAPDQPRILERLQLIAETNATE